jgi:phosphatidylserine decarboxylase
VFYAPADGVVLYAYPEVKPDEAIVEIKGKKFTPRDALDDQEYNYKSLVVGIFMTEYDVHVNRVPTSGYLSEVHRTPYLFTLNVSMKLEQDDITDHGGSKPDDMGYLFPNERCISAIYAPQIKSRYYVIQIAERDVDEILNWDYEHYVQGERYGMVRFGSQVDVIVPLDDDHEYELLVEKNWHVEAGVDRIIRVKKFK